MIEMISMGECLIELFSEEPIETSKTFTRSMAGDSFNIVVAASRLGTKTGYITKLGDDPFKGYLKNSFRSEGVDTSHVIVDRGKGFNAAHFVAVDENGEREFVYYRKGSAPSTIRPSDIKEAYISNAKIMHCSGIAQAISETSRKAVLKAARIAKDHGILVSYDPNYRHQLWTHKEARAAMEEIIPFVDIFLPSAPADTIPLFDTDNPESAVSEAQRRGVKTTVVTMGEKGSLLSSPERSKWFEPFIGGRVIDTTGAGDAYKGGFIHGLLEGFTPSEAATIGNISAGLTITGRGALGAIPDRKKVYNIYENTKGNK